MTLTSAIRTATNALANSSRQVATISQNISGVGNSDYVRRDTQVISTSYGQTVYVNRQVDQTLSEALGVANSGKAYQQVLNNYFGQLANVLDTDGDQSPSALLGSLGDAIDLAAANPSNAVALESVAERARDIAQAISSAYSHILALKQDADKAAGGSVDQINDLLASIREINDQIVQGTKVGRDVLDAMDQRDALVSKLSQEIGISVVTRADNDIAIYTSSGLTLFDKIPRSVEFVETGVFDATTAGNALYIDGVPATGPDAVLPITDGKLAGYIQARDELFTGQQNRLDELARGLVETFAEHDQTGGGKPDLAGLFTWSGGPSVPASGTLETGIALSLKLNPALDFSAGGDITLLRDGGINGDADYVSNATGAVSFSDRLLDLGAGISQSRSFDLSVGLGGTGGLDSFVDSFVGAFEQARSDASNKLAYQTELQARLQESLQSETGANLDYEMSKLLEVQKAYQASAKMIAAVDELFDTLLKAVG